MHESRCEVDRVFNTETILGRNGSSYDDLKQSERLGSPSGSTQFVQGKLLDHGPNRSLGEINWCNVHLSSEDVCAEQGV